MSDQTHTIALVGGTGPEGRGLATRFALAGHAIRIGSRDAARGTSAAHELASTLAGRDGLGSIAGGDNAWAVQGATIVILVVPYAAHRETVSSLRDALSGATNTIVVDAVVPVMFDKGPRPIEVPDGSAAEEAQALLPGIRVVGAFHNLSAEELLDPEADLGADVLVTGSDAEAKQTISDLARTIRGVRAVDAGPLRFTRFVEGITILLIGINGRYKTHSGVRITGLAHGR